MVGWWLIYRVLAPITHHKRLVADRTEVVTFGAKRCLKVRGQTRHTWDMNFKVRWTAALDGHFMAFHGISYDFLNHVKYIVVSCCSCVFSLFFTTFGSCFTFRNSVWHVDLPIRSYSICWFIPGPTNGWVPTSRKGLNVQRAKWQCVTSPMQPPCAMRRTLRPQALQQFFFGGLLGDLLPSQNCMSIKCWCAYSSTMVRIWAIGYSNNR